jgi:membrane-bound serine protease (ClpP class)
MANYMRGMLWLVLGIVCTHTHAQDTTISVSAYRQADRVAVITIHEPIDRITAYSVKRRMDMAIKGGAQAIVFDIDTPGGEVPAVLEICSAIKASSVPNTVAWVNPQAYSGGAIIALACREIVMADEAKMGDALPIQISPGGIEVATQGELRKKQVPPVLAEVVDSARTRGWDEFVVQAIVIDKVELWWIEEITLDSGEPQRLAVNESEFRLLFPDQEPPRGPPAIVGASTEGISGLIPGQDPTKLPVVPKSDTEFRPATPALEDLSPALSGESSAASVPDLDMMAAISARPILTAADSGKWRVVRYLTNGSGPIVMSKQELLDYGFGSRAINSDEELRAFFGATEVVRIKPTISERIVKVLSNMWVRMLLIAVFLLALFIEMVSPGLFVPSGIAVIALLLVMAPAWMLGLAGWWELIAIVSGIVLILIEIFIVPGFGVFGISGLVLLFGGLVMAFVGASGSVFPSSPAAQADLTRSAIMVLLAMATAGGGMFAFLKYFNTLPVLNRLVLTSARSADDSEISLVDAMGSSDELGLLVGEVGSSNTPLRPSGKVEIGDVLYDAKSDLGFIDPGTKVRVVRVQNWQIVVTPLDNVEGIES